MSDPLGTEPFTFKRMAADITVGLRYLRAYFGQRFAGMIGLVSDLVTEAASQAVVARLPGHPEQAVDSLEQVGRDRDLIRFRGETQANYTARIGAAWSDYAQGGTPQQLLHVINQWGQAGWPANWTNIATIDETTFATPSTPFVFSITVPFGNIEPPWLPDVYGAGDVYGETGLYYGIGQSSDLAMLVYLVRKWKPSRCKALVTVFYSSSQSVTITV